MDTDTAPGPGATDGRSGPAWRRWLIPVGLLLVLGLFFVLFPDSNHRRTTRRARSPAASPPPRRSRSSDTGSASTNPS
jgi:hypothetical protein